MFVSNQLFLLQFSTLLVLCLSVIGSNPVLVNESTASIESTVADQARSAATASSNNGMLADLKVLYGVYKECSDNDLSVCLKTKLVTAMDRASRDYKTIPILNDWIEIVKVDDNSIVTSEKMNEAAIETSLPRAASDQETALNQMIFERMVQFFQTHSFQLKLPSYESMKRSLTEDGRGKKKKFSNLMMLPLMLGGTMVPVILGAIAIMAFKALFVAKAALILAVIIALKKMFAGGAGPDKTEYVVNSAPPSSWSRSLNDGHELAYSAHKPSEQ